MAWGQCMVSRVWNVYAWAGRLDWLYLLNGENFFISTNWLMKMGNCSKFEGKVWKKEDMMFQYSKDH
jgi:hypothetical protein